MKLRFRILAVCLAAALILGAMPYQMVYADDEQTITVEQEEADTTSEVVAPQEEAITEASDTDTQPEAADQQQEIAEENGADEEQIAAEGQQEEEAAASSLDEEQIVPENEEETEVDAQAPETDTEEEEVPDSEIPEAETSEIDNLEIETLATQGTASITLTNTVKNVPAGSSSSLTYTIYVWDPSIAENLYSRALSGTYGNVTFTSDYLRYDVAYSYGLPIEFSSYYIYYGIATLTLAPGDSVDITDLPTNYSYYIFQMPVDKYYLQSITDTTGVGDTLYGSVYVENPSGHNDVEYLTVYAPYSLTLGEEVVSSDPASADQEFEYTVYFYKYNSSGNEPLFADDTTDVAINTYGVDGATAPNFGNTMTFTKTGSITLPGMTKAGVYDKATFKLKKGQNVVFENLGSEFGYYIQETDNIHYALYVFKSRHVSNRYTTYNYVSNYTQRYFYVDECSVSSSIAFQDVQEKLSISKEVVNNDTDRDFEFYIFMLRYNGDTGAYYPLTKGDYTLSYTGREAGADTPTTVHNQLQSEVQLPTGISRSIYSDKDANKNDYSTEWSVFQVKVAAGQTVTIEGLPAGIIFDIQEVPVDNYDTTPTALTTSNCIAYNGRILSSTMLMEDAAALFTNTYTPSAESKSLTIAKKVTGNAGDTKQAFTFHITLTDANGDPLKNQDIEVLLSGQTKTTVYTTDENGVLTITLKHGETITLKDLPKGTKYTIKETGAEVYTTGFSVNDGEEEISDEQSQSGTLDDDTAVNVTNDFTVKVPAGVRTETQPYILLLAIAAGCLCLLLAGRHCRKKIR